MNYFFLNDSYINSYREKGLVNKGEEQVTTLKG